MKKQLAAVWCGGASAVAMAALMVACVGDVSPSTAPRVDGTSTTDSARPVPDPAPGSDASTAARDASDELEGGGLLRSSRTQASTPTRASTRARRA